jgi:hypothetical protein
MPRFLAAACGVVAGCLVFAAGALAAPVQVSVFPSPGARFALPNTQIAFRGVPASALGQIQVSGSRTGAHAGRIEADSDGLGGSFIPSAGFARGETVTVRTSLDVIGGSAGAFQFVTADSAGPIQRAPLANVPARSNGVDHIHSRPDLVPPAVTVKRNSKAAAPGDVFVANQFGPAQNGPMILDSAGHVVWFKPMPRNGMATDFRVQSYGGAPVLTWWQGYENYGLGSGLGEIYDTRYRQIATVRAANGLTADLHEFELTPAGTALVLAASPVYVDTSSVRGAKRAVAIDGVIQEIDIRTGLMLFEWHSLDHVALSESYTAPPKRNGHLYDFFHANSVGLAPDGTIVASARNTWAVYDIDHQTGAVNWRLGGKRSTFALGRGVSFAWQHDARILPDGTVTVFDDGALPPVHKQSRGIRLTLDTTHRTASLLKEYDHSPSLLAGFEGNMQTLSGGDVFLGWGQQPYFTELNPHGTPVFDARFNAPTPTYRAYRMRWSGQPTTLPSAAVAKGAPGMTIVYASWNGATAVASWRVLAGATPNARRVLGTHPRVGFETAIGERSTGPYFQVQALGSSGQVIGTSAVARLR